MKIISLISENVKRLKAVEITPNGESIVVAGRNAQGKSSVLDSIVYALAGKGTVCERPIRDGESRAKITIDLGDLVVTRSFTASGGGVLKVVPKGEKHGVLQPQSVLDKLIGTLTFDPLAFSRQKESEQADCLRTLVGLDFSGLNAARFTFYEDRLSVGREVAILQGKLDGRALATGLPEREVDVADVLKAKQVVELRNRARQVDRDTLVQMKIDRDTISAHLDVAREVITDLQARLETAIAAFKNLDTKRVNAERACDEFYNKIYMETDESTLGFDRQIVDASATNEAIRRNAELIRQQEELNAKSLRYDNYSAEIDRIDAEKQDRLAKAKFPLPGLSFNSDGKVIFYGVPFSQISSAKQLKVSAAIALALNPTLRVMLIRDGSLLDDDSLAVLRGLAATNDAQLWIERVGGLSGDMAGVVIEDGEVSDSHGITRT